MDVLRQKERRLLDLADSQQAQLTDLKASLAIREGQLREARAATAGTIVAALEEGRRDGVGGAFTLSVAESAEASSVRSPSPLFH